MATSPPPSQGPQSGEEWLHNPCIPGVTIVERNQYGYICAISESQTWAGNNIGLQTKIHQGCPNKNKVTSSRELKDLTKSAMLHHKRPVGDTAALYFMANNTKVQSSDLVWCGIASQNGQKPPQTEITTNCSAR